MDDRPPELKELMAHLAENMPPLTQEEEKLLQRWADRYPKSDAPDQGSERAVNANTEGSES